jgi:hypothetical protein
MKTIQPPTGNIVPFQLPIRPALPTVYGNVDYRRFQEQLERMDEMLVKSGVERLFVEQSLEAFKRRGKEIGAEASEKEIVKHQEHSFRALRCTVLMKLLGESYRGMSRRLAECPLFRWFCGMEEMGEIRVPGKSTLQEYAHWLECGSMRSVIDHLLAAVGSRSEVGWNLSHEMELETVWMDTTCVKADIHFPVDWVLFRDAVRTLMKATLLIRRHGLKTRMEDPKRFMTWMNGLSIAMTHSRRVKDSKKQRKKTLRRMKRLIKKVAAHARRHRQLLDQEWEKTDWTRKQAEQVLGRIDGVLELLPQAQKQAHERIIGERRVENEDKILSLYEREVQVIVRGKAGAEVEFGNTLLLTEQKDGVIVDWFFHPDSAPADCKQLSGSLERLEKCFGLGRIKAVGTDRSFESSGNIELLKSKGIYNAICPKNPQILKQRLNEKNFVSIQKRRGQTEGRIAIFKNVFLGRPLRARKFGHRELSIAWNVLAHNLWVLVRRSVTEEKPLKKAA